MRQQNESAVVAGAGRMTRIGQTKDRRLAHRRNRGMIAGVSTRMVMPPPVRQYMLAQHSTSGFMDG